MTSTQTNPPEVAGATPAYIPWKSFAGYLAALKTTTIPHTLDSTVRPKAMAGGLWRQLTSALQFLGFINTNKVTQEAFRRVVKAYGTLEWKRAVSEYILPAYTKIIGDTPIDTATSGQLEKRFREHGKVDGQMLEKCVRFYLHALKDAGVKYSDYLAMRRKKTTSKRVGGNGKKHGKKDQPFKEDAIAGQPDNPGNGIAHREQIDDATSPGLIEQRLFFRGKPTGCIRVPKNLTEDDCKVIELTLAVLKAYAAQGGDATSH